MGTSVVDQQTVVIVDPCGEDYGHLLPMLEAHGNTPQIYREGHELLENLPRSVSCWMINYELPDMSGLELCRMLRPRIRRQPVFLVADQYDMDVELSVLTSGMAQMICKPLHGEWLRDRIVQRQAATSRVAPTASAAQLSGTFNYLFAK